MIVISIYIGIYINIHTNTLVKEIKDYRQQSNHIECTSSRSITEVK